MRLIAHINRNLRFAAAYLILYSGLRRREIRQLFIRTAAAFNYSGPLPRPRFTNDLLIEYAFFTREQVQAAINRGEDMQALQRCLFKEAFTLGNEYRHRLGVCCLKDAMAAARLIYRALSIDFRGGPDGVVEICRCAFAKIYTSEICAFISALDRGLIAGLTGGQELTFRQRLTEGATACRATIGGGIV